MHPSKIVLFESEFMFLPKTLVGNEGPGFFREPTPVVRSRVVWWLFFLSLSSFFLSSLTNATVCIVGTCAVTVVKRTVLEGGKYCPRRSMGDC